MAERRMFSKKVVNSGRFLQMPASSRLLYYDLGMNADDDGVVEAFTVMSLTKATDDDLKVLIAKGFVEILNEDKVAYIKDWKVNNKIRSDRYNPSEYKDLLLRLTDVTAQNDNQMTTKPQPNDNHLVDNPHPEDRLGKDRIGKDRLGKDRSGKEDRKRETTVSYFPDDALLEDKFKDYIDMRKKIRKPMTDRAIDLAIKHLRELAHGDRDVMVQILDQSVFNSWTGLYEIKQSNNTRKKGVDWDNI